MCLQGLFFASFRNRSSWSAHNSMAHVVFKRHYSSCSAPFHVSRGDTAKFSADLNFATEKIKIEFTQQKIKDLFESKVKWQLASRGLMVPGSLTDPLTQLLYFRTKCTLMSSCDLMDKYVALNEKEWEELLHHMVKTRVYVIVDWSRSYCKFCKDMYNHGIEFPDDGTDIDVFKAECDASFKDGKAKLAYIIWKGKKSFFLKFMRM
jgi:hypothetical protein